MSTQKENLKSTVCPECKHKSLRYRIDKTIHCNKCGYDSRTDKP